MDKLSIKIKHELGNLFDINNKKNIEKEIFNSKNYKNHLKEKNNILNTNFKSSNNQKLEIEDDITNLNIVKNMNINADIITPIKMNNQTDNTCLNRLSLIDEINNINTNNDIYNKMFEKNIFKENEKFINNHMTNINSSQNHIIYLNGTKLSEYNNNLISNLEKLNKSNTSKRDKNFNENYNQNKLFSKNNTCPKIENNIEINYGIHIDEQERNVENFVHVDLDLLDNKSRFNIIFNSILMEFSKMHKKMNLLDNNLKSYYEQLESFNNESIFINKNSAFITKNKEYQKLLETNIINNNYNNDQIIAEEIKNLLDLSNKKIDYLTNLITKNFVNSSCNNGVINSKNSLSITDNEKIKSVNNHISDKINTFDNKTQDNMNSSLKLRCENDKNNSENKKIFVKNYDYLTNLNNEDLTNNYLICNNNDNQYLNNTYNRKNENSITKSKTIDSFNYFDGENGILNGVKNLNKNKYILSLIHDNTNKIYKIISQNSKDEKNSYIDYFSIRITEMIESQYIINKLCNYCLKIKYNFEIKECLVCLTKFCKDCAQFCVECSSILCQNCIGCRICQEPVCIKCRKSCISCKLEIHRVSQNDFSNNKLNYSNNVLAGNINNLDYFSDKQIIEFKIDGTHDMINHSYNKAILVCNRCLLRCFHCNQLNCSECIQECQKCNKNVCHEIKCLSNYNDNSKSDIKNDVNIKIKICSKTCKNCAKCVCSRCESPNDFIKCPCCKDFFCNSCKSICFTCKQVICKKCFDKCKKCHKTICKKCSFSCNNCREALCSSEACSKQNLKSKCKKCNKNFCNLCIKDNNTKCTICQESYCKKCILICGKCEADICLNSTCNLKCDNCSTPQCSKCLILCVCKIYKFCENCSLDISPINPHECNTFLNDTPYFRGLKGRSKIKLPKKNFEIKLFLEKYSGQNLSIGITDNGNFDQDTMLFIDNIWVVKLDNGMKYSSDNSVEPFLKNGGLKEFDFLYLIIEKNNILYFKINNFSQQKAFVLDKEKDYYLYMENDDKLKDFKITFIYVRAL